MVLITQAVVSEKSLPDPEEGKVIPSICIMVGTPCISKYMHEKNIIYWLKLLQNRRTVKLMVQGNFFKNL